jgi:transcriptional regulator with XRE-family HTH domain
METFFSNNLKLLRKKKGFSQEDLAKATGLKRHDIDNYERGIGAPPENMISIADLFKVSVDTMLRIDLGKLSPFGLRQLEMGFDSYVRGTKLRVLATTVDSNNRENVELVSHRAQAGYTAGYNDPEFIGGLPTFNLPFLSREKKYRMFQIDGDSMLPIPNRSHVIGEFIQNWHDIKDGHAYIFLTRNDGIVFKVAYNEIRKKKHLLLKSLNRKYEPYEVPANEILEVWRFVNYISTELPDITATNSEVFQKVEELRKLIAS